MNIAQYLNPINPDLLGYRASEYTETMGNIIEAHLSASVLPEIPKGGLVLVGVEEDRGVENNAGCANAPNEIRRYFYNLAVPTDDIRIADLGNIILGQTPEDTYFALSIVLSEIVANGSTLIVLGGSQDLTLALYKGYANLNRIINITTIDPRFDLEKNDIATSRTWIRDIIMHTPNYLFFLSNVGYQNYFVGEKYIKLMDELKFDVCRLGEAQKYLDRAEALIRNADIVSVDIASVRQSDAPGNGNPSPHGFYGEEMCQLMRFAGMSDKTSCLGMFEINPLFDNNGQTAHMAAQAIWHFIEGFCYRKHDHPQTNPENCKHYIVKLEDPNLDIEFFKGKLSDRWWIKVPCNDEEKREIYSHHLMLPCTYSDYQMAANGEIPQLWWSYYQRLNS
ncbi:MAG: formimidoylglutamase [Bacteroidales bacterium]|nr:formimidoylglutamase [Candidatus Colimorpha merdihippi]